MKSSPARFLRTRGMTACVSCLTVRTRTALVKSDGETESSSNDDEEGKDAFWVMGSMHLKKKVFT